MSDVAMYALKDNDTAMMKNFIYVTTLQFADNCDAATIMSE